ncbi:MAG: DNA polymerase I [Candidatus Omnitrophota bacterium]
MKSKVILLDGSALCYRAYYAIRSLTTSSGQPTNAVYGFVSMLNKLIAQYQPDYLGVTFDLKGPTFRHERFSEYKIQRKPMPDELAAQLPVIKEVLKAYRIAVFEEKGFEADDVIATLVKKISQAMKNETEIFIVTGDKDILQLVSDQVKVINPHKGNEILDLPWIRHNLGVEPEKIKDIMALAGDTSDNIPGVPGIGMSTAIELVKAYGSLDGVLANVEKIKNKSRAEKIKTFTQQAQMSRELTVLVEDIARFQLLDSAALLEQLKLVEPDKAALFSLFKGLEFKSLLQNLAPEQKNSVSCKLLSEKKDIAAAIKGLQANKPLAFYFMAGVDETIGGAFTACAFTQEKDSSYYCDLKDFGWELLKPVLEDERIKKWGHDLKYTQVVLANYGIILRGLTFDTMLGAYLLNPTDSSFSLNDLALAYLDRKIEAERDLQSAKETAQALAQKADAILALGETLQAKLRKADLLSLLENIDLPLSNVLAQMEQNGIALDKDYLLHLYNEFEHTLKILTKDIFAMAGEEFNINSPKQLGVILFEKLRLPPVKRTKTGLSTDTEVLIRLARAHPIATSLLEFREVSKLKSTYVDGLMKLLNPRTGKIHTSFNQAATATGRLSSSQPNLQNIPIKTALGKKIRKAFIANSGSAVLLSADYSQIELRILAHLSADKSLSEAFKKDADIHAYTASLIFGVKPEAVDEQKRAQAKTVNFGIIYGMSAFGLAKDLGIAQNQAQEFIDAYFKRYPGVKKYIEAQIKKAEKDGYVSTLLKRRRYIPEILSKNESVRQFAQRTAINTPVQGSASDLIKKAMIEIHRELEAQQLAATMLLQVHDELVFNVPTAELEEMKMLVVEKMEHAFKLSVPIKVSVKTGKNWMEMK